MDRFNTFKLFIETNRNKIIIAILILIMFASTIMFLNIDSKVKVKTESKVFSNLNLKSDEEQVTTKEEQNEYYFIDIKGEVLVPGVYSLEKGKRVIDAINVAGGLTENADTTLINQSLKLEDQMVIVIYSKDAINNIESLKEVLETKEEVCNQEVQNDACVCNSPQTVVIPDIENKNDTNDINNNVDTNNKIESNDSINNSNNLININTASLELLMTLPKIGEVKAKAIISYRDTNGTFNSIEEIKQVKGIGDSLFETIKDYITI